MPDELVLDNTSPFTIRIKRPDEAISIKDYIKGNLSFESKDIDSFIIMNQYKAPTYNFACAVDDMLSDISIVIRSEEHIDNTPQQDLVRTSLGYEKKIEYAHLPIILDDNSSVKWLLEEGFLPEAIVNYLILMENKTPKKIFSMSEAIEWFDLSSISKTPARFDIEMLRHINHEHLNNLENKELSRYVGFADEEIGKLAKVYLSEVSTTKELKSKISAIFATKEIPKELLKSAKTLTEIIKNAPYFDDYSDFEGYIMNESGLNSENFLKPLRYLLTGAENGPDISDIYKYLKNYIGGIVK